MIKLNTENKEPIILFIATLVFYIIQIPAITANADALTFSIRSINDIPILDYAYLDSSTLVTNTALPNYHLGHTIIMWLFYQIIPSFSNSVIILSGFVSALGASLVVLITYLIWLKLGFSKRVSLLTSILFAVIPSFWFFAVLGEIHSLQMLFILLFVYTFINKKYVLSTITFLIANLISPLSGLAFGLVYIGGFSKKIFYKSVLVGSAALLVYILIFYLIGADFSIILNEAVNQSQGRGLLYRICILIFFIIINLNIFSLLLISGFKKLNSINRKLLITLFIATIPQLLLLFVSSAFFIEKGSFQIPIFWFLVLPVGIALSEIKLKTFKFAATVFIYSTIAVVIWFYPHWQMSKDYNEAGIWLRQNQFHDYSVIGPWTVSIPIISERNGNSIDSLNYYYYDLPAPSDYDLIKTGKNKLIISDYNKTVLREELSKIGIPGLTLHKYNPEKTINIGKVKKIYKNKFVTLYLWEK